MSTAIALGFTKFQDQLELLNMLERGDWGTKKARSGGGAKGCVRKILHLCANANLRQFCQAQDFCRARGIRANRLPGS